MSVTQRNGRRRTEHRSTRTTLALSGAALALVAAIIYVAVNASNGLPGKGTYTLRAELHDLADLGTHNDVRMAGRRVGQVLDPRLEHGQPVVDVQLDADVEPLRSDTRLRVRAKGLLGQRFLEIVPGRRGRPLPDGGHIPRAQSSATVSLPTAINALDAKRRDALRTTLGGLGAGLADRGEQVNWTLRVTPPFLSDIIATSDAVLARPGAAARLVPSLESAMRALEPARAALAQSFAPAAQALAPFVDRRAAMHATLDEAPSALAALRHGLSRTDPLLTEVERLAGIATAALPAAPAALNRTRRLLASTPRPLRATDRLLRRAEAVTPATLRLVDRATPQLPGVDRLLTVPLPVVEQLGAHGCDVLGWARNWRSMLGWGVPGGGKIGPHNLLRLQLIASPESVGGLERPIASGRFGRNPYPKPCQAGKEERP